MNCPKCITEKMTARTFEGIEIDYCKSCRGYLFDRGELTSILKKKLGHNADTLAYSSVTLEMDKLAAVCPRCRTQMSPAKTREGVKIDFCKSCGCTFLDQGELATLQAWIP